MTTVGACVYSLLLIYTLYNVKLILLNHEKQRRASNYYFYLSAVGLATFKIVQFSDYAHVDFNLDYTNEIADVTQNFSLFMTINVGLS